MNTPFRFVHTADLHLDSPLKSLARQDAELAAQVENATREALTRTINLCLDEKVHALLIAGDIYDSQNPSVPTAGFYVRELNRLAEAGVRVYTIRGNHDHFADLSNTVPLPEHVTEFIGNKKVDVLDEFGVAIHGVSFKKEHATESALRNFRAPDDKLINIALLHTSLGGSEGHDIYAPCSVAELDSMGFDYWALGHIHQRQQTGSESTIVMPGTPQGRDMGEDGSKSVSLVSIDEQSCHVEQRIVSPIRFEKITLHLTSESELASSTKSTLIQLNELFTRQVEALKTEHPFIDRWIIRVECVATADTLYGLRIDPEHTAEALKLTAENLNSVHVDKIRYTVHIDPEAPATTDHALLTQLKSVVMENLDDELLVSISNGEFDDLVKLIPTADVRNKLQDTAEVRAQTIKRLQTEGVDELLSMIQIDQKSGS